MHPFQGGDLVEQPDVGDVVVEDEEALRAEPVVDGHQHDSVAGEAAPVVDDVVAGVEAPTGDPHHDWLPGVPGLAGPDVDVEVVGAGDGGEERVEGRRRRELWRCGAVGTSVTHSGPGRRRVRWQESVRAAGCGGVGDPEEAVHAVLVPAAHPAGPRRDHGPLGGVLVGAARRVVPISHVLSSRCGATAGRAVLAHGHRRTALGTGRPVFYRGRMAGRRPPFGRTRGVHPRSMSAPRPGTDVYTATASGSPDTVRPTNAWMVSRPRGTNTTLWLVNVQQIFLRDNLVLPGASGWVKGHDRQEDLR